MSSATLVDAGGAVVEGPKRADIESRLSSRQFFWLDLASPGDEELGWLGEPFGFHPLSVEDAEHFSQRPKIEDYQNYVFLVLYGSAANVAPVGPAGAANAADTPDVASPEELQRLSEMHCFVASNYMVTVHHDDCAALKELANRVKGGSSAGGSPAKLFYRVADTLVDSFFPVLSELDDRIDELQAQVMRRPTNDQLSELLQYKSTLIAIRRVIAPQRDLFASLSSGVEELPGFDDESSRYFRDVYDHLIRLSDLVDSYRDLLSGTTDAYLSVVSNRLNAVMKQLTIIATVFLPLSYLTGFFGQNFGWLVQRLGSFGVFVGVGIGTELVAVGLLMYLFYKRGWFGST